MEIKTPATVKKFETQGSKGGCYVIKVEIPLTPENAALAPRVNDTVALTFDFDQKKIDESVGQERLDYED